MAATSFPIKTGTAQRFLAAAVSPKKAYADGAPTGAQATDADGVPLWRVSVFVMDADSQRAPEPVSVTVPAQTAPAIPQLQPVVFHGLRVMLWSGGATLRADFVEPLPPDTAPAPADAASAFLSDIDIEEGQQR